MFYFPYCTADKILTVSQHRHPPLSMSPKSLNPTIPNCLSTFSRWDPKKRMTPEEAVHHDWLVPGNSSSSSATFIITSSNSATSLMKHSRDQLKENDQTQQQQLLQKYQRSQPITPLTILPQIKTPSNRVSQRYNNTVIGTKDQNNRIKGETALKARLDVRF